jgi:hypothetical protein
LLLWKNGWKRVWGLGLIIWTTFVLTANSNMIWVIISIVCIRYTMITPQIDTLACVLDTIWIHYNITKNII